MFQELMTSAKKGYLILVDDGICRFNIRRDGVLVIYEIISLRRGVGTVLLERLKNVARVNNCAAIVAKCPAHLESNRWYEKKGFVCISQEYAKTGTPLNVWRLAL